MIHRALILGLLAVSALAGDPPSDRADPPEVSDGEPAGAGTESVAASAAGSSTGASSTAGLAAFPAGRVEAGRVLRGPRGLRALLEPDRWRATSTSEMLTLRVSVHHPSRPP